MSDASAQAASGNTLSPAPRCSEQSDMRSAKHGHGNPPFPEQASGRIPYLCDDEDQPEIMSKVGRRGARSIQAGGSGKFGAPT